MLPFRQVDKWALQKAPRAVGASIPPPTASVAPPDELEAAPQHRRPETPRPLQSNFLVSIAPHCPHCNNGWPTARHATDGLVVALSPLQPGIKYLSGNRRGSAPAVAATLDSNCNGDLRVIHRGKAHEQRPMPEMQGQASGIDGSDPFAAYNLRGSRLPRHWVTGPDGCPAMPRRQDALLLPSHHERLVRSLRSD